MEYSKLFVLVLLFLLPHSTTAVKNDNCKGSGLCGSMNPTDCRRAVDRYSDGTIYSGYTSRVSGHCTAIFRCDGRYPSIRGSVLKDQFLHVYNHQPCKKCGSHAFDGGNCEATLNYCANCRDSGNPNSIGN